MFSGSRPSKLRRFLVIFYPVDRIGVFGGGAANRGFDFNAGEGRDLRGDGGGSTASGSAIGEQVLNVQEEGWIDWVPVQVRRDLLRDPSVPRETRVSV